jgi:hypothetical protein
MFGFTSQRITSQLVVLCPKLAAPSANHLCAASDLPSHISDLGKIILKVI